MSYASKTEVPIEKSRAEIEATVRRYGASGFMSGWTDEQAMVMFAAHSRQVKFIVKMPKPDEKRFTTYKRGQWDHQRTPSAARQEWEQACRQRWRALALVIKAKLEAVESGISVFEDEFLANIVLPDGQLVGNAIRPAIASAYETGDLPPLLPDYSGRP